MPQPTIHGPWSGGVTHNSAIVKAFVSKGSSASLTLHPAGSPANPIVPAMRVHAGTDWEVVRFELSGLSANTEYRYTLMLNGLLSGAKAGRFCTFPPPDAPASFRFLCGGDAGGSALFGEDSNHVVFDWLREREVFDATGQRRALFFMHLGDMHYRNIDSSEVVDHLRGYRKTLEQARQGAFWRQLPFAYTWDDHDFCGNASHGQSPGCAAACMAYDIGIPHYPLAGSGGLIYQVFTVGRVRFVLTDTRAARSRLNDPDGPAKTMLGAAQKQWLKDELRASKDRYVLVVWVNSAPWLGGTADIDGNEDGWANYQTERAELGGFVEREGLRNILMLCADAHMIALDDGSHNRGATGAGGFPVFHSAPLDRPNSVKGGKANYSHNVFGNHRGQFGLVEIVDDGQQPRCRVTLTGKRMSDSLLSYSFTSPREG
jgi:phosphodiesterase/alkaline phosphatase D-like protein